jgi:predicted transport protein
VSDIKLFSLKGAPPVELTGKSVALEKSLQNLIEAHLDTFLGVRFLATEYSTGKVHGGRIDTLGIDENGCPVIIEYKRSTNENVINQGLFYLDWLMDHRGEFELLVLKKLGKEVSDDIEWTGPRLICIAGDFTKYDGHAVQQINRNIQLLRYRQYGDELLLLELVNSVKAEAEATIPLPAGSAPTPSATTKSQKGSSGKLTLAEQFAIASGTLRDRYEALKAFVLGMGDDVEETHLKRYVAFKRIKNFVCVVPLAHTEQLIVFVKVDPTSLKLEEGFTRDVSEVGHWGTGDLEITLRTADDFERAKPLLLKSYEAS